MMSPALLSDLLLYLHFLIVLAVIVPVPLIVLGKLLDWQWVCNKWFRLAHLGVILFIVINSTLGNFCPLTNWEHQYRMQAIQQGNERTLPSQWIENLLYYDVPLWVFAVIYAAFGAIVIGLLFWVPPEWKKKSFSGES